MQLPLTTLLRKEQAAEAAVSGSSARKAPEGKPWKKEVILIVLYRLADARHFPRRGKQGA